MPRKKQPPDDKLLSKEEARKIITEVMSQLFEGIPSDLISFQIQPDGKAGQTLSLKLTQLQRDSLLHHTRVTNKIKKQLQTVGKGTQNIDVTHDEIDYLIGEIESAACSAPTPHKKRLQAVLQKLSELSSMERVGILEKKTPKSRKKPLKKSDLLYQFKITLLDVKPAIWRRIQVPDCNLNDLHEYIQAAFGWWNSHMHQFEIAGRTYSQPSPFGDDFGMEFRDETDVLLSTLIPKSGGRFRWIYEYDFGDGWRHEIVFEGFPAADPKAKVPLCLEGKRACPPEDCGGPWGYADYLAIMANPKHRDYKEMLEWNGLFDPEAFDVKKATTAMRKIKTSSR